MSYENRSGLLRRALTTNGYFSLVTGAIAALFAGPLARVMEIHAGLVIGVGVGVVAFGAAVLWTARRTEIDLTAARLILWADAAWVVGAAALIAVPGSMTITGKVILGGVSLFVAGFALAQHAGIRRVEEGPKRIATEVEIRSGPELVWDVLTDLEEYGNWNPFIVSGEGEPHVGRSLRLSMRPPGGREIPMRPEVTQSESPRSFEWLGHLGVKGLFDGRHRFVIDQTDSGVKVTHSEEFTGILVPLLSGMLDGKTKAGFLAMNDALKERVESIEATRS